MRKMIISYRVLVRKSEGKRPLERLRGSSEGNITGTSMYLDK
jgi:hypothetical protein